MDPTSDALGAVLAVGAGLTALLLGSRARTSLPAALLAGLLAVSGAAVGAGALLLQDRDVGVTSWVLTVGSMALMVPFHVRVVFGPLGRPRSPQPG